MLDKIRSRVPNVRRRYLAIPLVGALVATAGLGGAARMSHAATPATPPTCTTSWQTVPSSAFPKDLRDLEVIGGNDIWAVGSHTENQVLTAAEHWDGNSWTLFPTPSPGAGENALNGAAAIATDDVWSVGYYQVAKKNANSEFKTLAEHWDGTSWTVSTTPNQGTDSNTLSAVDAVSSTDVWAVGYYYVAGSSLRRTLLEHWNGASWSVMPSPNPGTDSNALLSINVVSGTDIWAAGYQSDGMGYSPLLLHYDGVTGRP